MVTEKTSLAESAEFAEYQAAQGAKLTALQWLRLEDGEAWYEKVEATVPEAKRLRDFADVLERIAGEEVAC